MCPGCTWGHGGTKVAPSWMPVTALSLLTSGHSGWGVSRHPCCLAVGPRPCPCDPVRRRVIRSWLSSNSLALILFSFFRRFCGPLHSDSRWSCFCSLTRFYRASARCDLRLSQEWLSGFRAFLQCCFLWHSWPRVRRRQLFSYFGTCADPQALATVTGTHKITTHKKRT